MKNPERLRRPATPSAISPMAARAVGLCEGCPLAKFCAIKPVAPCETEASREDRIETSGGSYDGNLVPELDKPVTLSYRKQLMDDTIPTVVADLRKRKDIRPPVPRWISSVPAAASTQSPPSRNRRVTPKQPPHVERPPESGAGIVADILVSMIGVSAIATARGKKSV